VFPTRVTLALTLVLIFAGLGLAQKDAPVVSATRGTVDKVEKDTLTVRTRKDDGTFGKALTLKVTGTSRISTLTTQTRGKKVVHVQRDTDAKDLQPKQPITLIYTSGPDGDVLLAAVVQPVTEK
jgi:hypothetical protein